MGRDIFSAIQGYFVDGIVPATVLHRDWRAISLQSMQPWVAPALR